MSQAVLEGFAISPEQERVWQQQEAHTGGASLRAEAVVAVTGVAAERVGEALTHAVRRHEILRTRFERVPGLLWPVQVVAPAPVAFALERRTGTADEEATLAAAFEHLRTAADAPGLRALWVEGPARSLLCLALPALCADAGTLRALASELMATTNRDAALPAEPPLQYADVAAWLNELPESARAQAPGMPGTDATGEASGLPWSARPGSVFLPRSVGAALAPELVERLARLARAERVSESAVYLACWQASLASLMDTGAVDVSVAMEARRFPELLGALGPLTRHIPVRVELDPRCPFRELLRAAGEALAAASTWEAYCRWSGAARPHTLVAAFDCPEIGDDERSHDPSWSLLASQAQAERFVLNLAVRRDSAANLTLHYDAGCVERGEAARLVAQLAERLAHLAEAPGASTTHVLRPSPAERTQLALEWNRTDVARPAALTLHGLFEAQVARQPEALAAFCEGRTLGFDELNRRANRLAHGLRRLGVAADVPVLVCAERSLERLVAALAILKAGGGYVPLDPANPPERLGFMLADTGAPLALADERAVAMLSGQGVHLLEMRAFEAQLAHESEDNLDGAAWPEGLAYVIYTSGSTGRPKGVMVSHAAIVNRILWGQEAYPLDGADRVLQSAAFGFDFSVWETFAPLASGAAVVLPRPDGHRDPAYLVRLIDAQAITTAHFVPSMLQVFLDELELQRCPSLRLVFCGGEALPASLAQRFFELCPGAVLYNQYGPTETTVDSTFHRCLPGADVNTVPIGRPVANTRTYVLDRALALVPGGSPGELCIGGVGLARGYLGRPDLTAACFVPDAQGGVPGARLYRSGDVVRQRVDGSLEFLGRRDQQVKVRGARIEVGEIESALLAHPAMREAAVLAPRDPHGDNYLAAYVACDERVTTADLRAFLALRLPDAMVPSCFVRLAALPRSASGKLDRRALPAPAPDAPEPGAGRVAPRTALEERLAGLFAAVLRVPQVGIHDDFFQLGGHSLLAMRLVSRVRETSACELPLRTLFEAPTVAGLAAVVEAWSAEHDAAPLAPIARGSRSLMALLQALDAASDAEAELQLAPGAAWLASADAAATPAATPSALLARLTAHKRRVLLGWLEQHGPEFHVFPLSFAQERLWVFEQLYPAAQAYNIPVALRLHGALDRQALRQALDGLVARHEVLRSTYFAVDGQPFQVMAGPAAPAFSERDLEGQADPAATARQLAMAEARTAFDLGQGPLLRASLYRLRADEHVLLLVTHHIAFDGWSLGVLVDELSHAYRASAQGVPAHLAAPTLQYADFALWQRRLLTGPLFERQSAYWRARLARAPLTTLPTDHPAPRVARFRGARESTTLPASVGADLRTLGQSEGATLFMALLAAFVGLIERYTQQGDVTVLSSVANRDRAGLEGVVGFFVNLVALRVDAAQDPTFRQLLARARSTAREAYAHQDLPFEQVVEALRPARSVTQAPFSSLALTLQSGAAGTPDFGALAVTPFEVESGSAKTDLTLHVAEDGDALVISAEYNLDLFERETMRRLLAHYSELLSAALQAPDAPLSTLPPEAGQALLLVARPSAGLTDPQPSLDLAERSNLSASQLRFWLGQQLQPASPIFNMVTTFTVRGALDVAAFSAAAEAVLRGSDALGSVVREVDGVPQQTLQAPTGALLEHVDLSTADDARGALESWVHARSRTLLPLESRPFELALLSLPGHESVVYVAHHHVIADGWSTGLVWQHLAQAYARAQAGTLAPLALPAFQDFVQEERGFRATGLRARSLAYWRAKLAQPLEPLAFYGHRSQAPATHGQRVRCVLGLQRVARLRALAVRPELRTGTEDLTLLSLFGATLAAFLHQVSGVRNVSLGLVHHNRYTRRLAETIGMLIEILPLHVTVAADETFVSLARKLAREALDTLKHARHPVATPVKQRTWHALLNYIGREPLPTLAGAPVEMEWVHTGHQDESLAVHVHPTGSSEDLVIDMDWDSALLATQEAAQAGEHLVMLLDALLADPDRRLDEVGLLARERASAAALREEVGFDF